MNTAGIASPDATELRDAMRAFLSKECAPAAVRTAWEASEVPRDRWQTMGELGYLGVAASSDFGGLELGEGALPLLLEECGSVCLPEPYAETAAVVIPVLERWGTVEQRTQWVPRLCSGDAIATIVLDQAPLAPYGQVADVALVQIGVEVHLLSAEQFTVVPVTTRDQSRRSARLQPEGASDRTRVPGDGALEATRMRATAATAAVLNGVSRKLLDLATEYAKERHQFGRPIGSFQAVQHMLAEVAVEVETARPAAWAAIHAIAAEDPGAATMTAVAKAAASSAAALASYHALQVHGGIGFTWEHDLLLWLHRAKALEQVHGSTEDHYAALARAFLASLDPMDEFGPAVTAP